MTTMFGLPFKHVACLARVLTKRVPTTPCISARSFRSLPTLTHARSHTRISQRSTFQKCESLQSKRSSHIYFGASRPSKQTPPPVNPETQAPDPGNLSKRLFAAGCVGAVGTMYLLLSRDTQPTVTMCEAQAPVRESRRVLTSFIADAAEQVQPAVVNITASVATSRWWSAQSRGSGFFIRADGTLLTNAHVVSDNGMPATELTVHLADGRIFSAHVVALDIISDIAIVRVDNPGGEKFPVAKLGKSSDLRPGEWAIALGSPLCLDHTITHGIVSALSRPSTEIGMPDRRINYIQTDAAINVGNSGGPLINIDGEVIGINSMTAQGINGISFAIPIDEAMNVVSELERFGRVVRPYVGLRLVTLDQRVAQKLQRTDRMFQDMHDGVLIVGVEYGGPAYRAGIRPGDVISTLQGHTVKTADEFLDRLQEVFEPGQPISIGLVRRGKVSTTISLVPGEA